MNNLDPISKRARTKIVIRRSKSEAESSDKATEVSEAPVGRKKRYSDKGKSSVSNPVQDGSVDASVNGKQEASCLPEEEENATTPAKRLSKKKKSKANGESTEINPVASPELSPGIEPVLALEAATPIAKKRKNKEKSDNIEKKRKTKSGSEPSRKRLPKVNAGRSGASKSKGKSKVSGQSVGEDMTDVLLKGEVRFFLCVVCFLFSFEF